MMLPTAISARIVQLHRRSVTRPQPLGSPRPSAASLRARGPSRCTGSCPPEGCSSCRAKSRPSSKPERYKALLTKLDGSADQFAPKDIDQARVEFGQFSEDLIAFLREFMPQLDDPLYTIKCPMWNKSPAVWLQDSTEVKNPFLGPDMPTCGTVQETLRAER